MYTFAVFALVTILVLTHRIDGQNAADTTIEEVFFPPRIGHDGSQSYTFRQEFKTTNNIERFENGYEDPKTDFGLVVRGSYSYIRPDGQKETVIYIADRNGFRISPEPAPPLFIPPAALASLAG